jgi:uncharacterized protein YuzE
MKLTVDPDADALSLLLNDAEIVRPEQVAPGVVLDYDAQDNLVGVEVLHLSKRSRPVDTGKLVFEILRARQPAEMVARAKPSPLWREMI